MTQYEHIHVMSCTRLRRLKSLRRSTEQHSVMSSSGENEHYNNVTTEFAERREMNALVVSAAATFRLSI